MAKVGRPPQDSTQTRQTYRLPATLIARLAEEKARTGVPTSEFIRRAIEAALPKFKVGDRVRFVDFPELRGIVESVIYIGNKNWMGVRYENNDLEQVEQHLLVKMEASNDL